jgi:hypothetical protein
MTLRSTDFKSVASTNSATRATEARLCPKRWRLVLARRPHWCAGAAIERLRHGIIQLINFGIAHDVFVGRILMAAATGEAAAGAFLTSLAGRHPRLLLELIARDRDRIVQRLDWSIKGLTPGGC